METYAPGGAGVHPEPSHSLDDYGPVAVPVYDDPCVRTRRGVDQSMHKMQLHALQVQIYPQRQGELSELRVIVPRDRCHRRDACEGGEHRLGTDVSGVQDEVNAFERGRHSRV